MFFIALLNCDCSMFFKTKSCRSFRITSFFVNDAFAGDPYAGFRSQILNLPKPNRNLVAKNMIQKVSC